MEPSGAYRKIIEKAHLSFKDNPENDWDYPDYGGNLSEKEIAGLSSEHVDAIQVALSEAQDQLASGGKPTAASFMKSAVAHYEKITRPSKKKKPGR